jgi:hypothetical protein
MVLKGILKDALTPGVASCLTERIPLPANPNHKMQGPHKHKKIVPSGTPTSHNSQVGDLPARERRRKSPRKPGYKV